jgi:hypothetical protein
MKREKIEGSSNIAEIGYDKVKEVLEVKFHTGSIYQYSPVPETMYKGLMSAESKGKFLNNEIKWAAGINFKRVG